MTSYVAKANWYTFILCYLLHVNLSPSSPFWGQKPPSQNLCKLNSELTVQEPFPLLHSWGDGCRWKVGSCDLAIIRKDHPRSVLNNTCDSTDGGLGTPGWKMEAEDNVINTPWWCKEFQSGRLAYQGLPFPSQMFPIHPSIHQNPSIFMKETSGPVIGGPSSFHALRESWHWCWMSPPLDLPLN